MSPVLAASVTVEGQSSDSMVSFLMVVVVADPDEENVVKWSSVLVALVVVAAVVGLAVGLAGCASPEAVRLYRGDAGQGSQPDVGIGGGGTLGSGGITGTGGVVGTGGRVGSGGATGTGGLSASGGATGTGGRVGTGGTANTGGAVGSGGRIATGGGSASGGVVGTGGAVGTGGRAGTGGGVGTGGAVGTGGRVATGGAVGTGGAVATGGRAGTGGVGGGNCVSALKNAGYAAGGQACADCKENTISLTTKCTAMIDCLGPLWPCSPGSNCWTACLNTVSGSQPLDSCVRALTTAACQ